MRELLDWLGALPDPLLYAALVAAAFAENIFPPLPADTVIALGAFVAARGNGSALGVWIATMIGNLGGAMVMYGLGHRFGLPWLQRRFPSLFRGESTEGLARRFRSGGVLTIAISRFLPGVRALVPPVAGAISIGAMRAAIAMTVASGVWYGIVCVLAFRAGQNADVLIARIGAQQRTVSLVAAAIVVAVVLVVLVRRRRRRSPGSDA